MTKNEKMNNEELLTPNEVALLLKCDVKSVYNWTKRGLLVRYAIAKRVYYKRSEVLSSLIRID
jgi:hypothetical protein